MIDIAETTPARTAPPLIRTLRSVEELDALAAELAADGTRLAANIDLCRAVVRTLPNVIRPHVLVLERDGTVEGLLLARLERAEMPASFGYATLYSPSLRCLVVATDGVAGAPSDQDLLTQELVGALRSGDADVVTLQHVVVDSTLHAAALRRAPRFSRQRFLAQEPHWVLDVPDSAEELLGRLPKGVRDNLRRYSRKLTRELGERLETRCYSSPEDFDVIMRDVEAVAATTYQRGLSAGFHAEADAPFVREALSQGFFRAWVLYIDGTPCAFETGYAHNGSVVIAAKGFDPAYGRHHAGKVLQLRLLEDLCADPTIRTLDFGFGDAEYKQRLSNRGWFDVDVTIYARTWRGLRANAGRTAVLAADHLARRAAARLASEDRVAQLKRRWRERRTPPSSS
jgi:CelD/BcsL family acetyltransferase involved in cellulose biosynthesis